MPVMFLLPVPLGGGGGGTVNSVGVQSVKQWNSTLPSVALCYFCLMWGTSPDCCYALWQCAK